MACKYLVVSVAVVAALGTSVPAQGATLYFEDFSGQEGQGAIGTSTVGTPVDGFGAPGSEPDVDTTAVEWSLNLNAAALFDDNDFLRVVDGAFTAQDTNAGCSTVVCGDENGGPLPALPEWLSPVIDVAGFTNLSFSLDASGSEGPFEVAGGINEEDDFIVSLILDGDRSVFADLIEANGPFPNQTVSGAIADGSTLQIAVQLNNYANSEAFAFDNVSVTGDEITSDTTSVPEPMTLWGLAAIGLALGTAVGRRQAA